MSEYDDSAPQVDYDAAPDEECVPLTGKLLPPSARGAKCRHVCSSYRDLLWGCM